MDVNIGVLREILRPRQMRLLRHACYKGHEGLRPYNVDFVSLWDARSYVNEMIGRIDAQHSILKTPVWMINNTGPRKAQKRQLKLQRAAFIEIRTKIDEVLHEQPGQLLEQAEANREEAVGR